MQAIILAAGMGKRLKELTAGNTKCMVKVGERTLIERVLTNLDKKSLNKIIVVVGYKGQNLIDYIDTLNIKTPIEFIDNPIYDKTNNIYSLSLAKDNLCEDDTLLLESDLIFEDSIIDFLLEDERKSLALVDKFESWMDGTCMKIDKHDCIVDFIPGKYLDFSEKGEYYKTVNIYKFSKEFCSNTYVPFLEAYSKAMGNNEYYESVIKLISMLNTNELRVKRLEGQKWYEIDDVQDLDIAESLFADSLKDKYKKIAKRYGGYWRFPKLLDYCYLVNPYYPTKKLKDEMKSNFDILLEQYPSGLDVNSLLAAKYFGVKKEHIVIGNGAAELIKVVLENLAKENKTIGFIKPTFEEYPNRYPKDLSVYFNVQNRDYNYTIEDIKENFKDKNINALVLINPDNPSGNFINNNEVLSLLDWCKNNSILLILDESFVDFAPETTGVTQDELDNLSFIHEELLNKYKDNLIVIKSISKSFGIPGVRLGVLSTANENIIKEIKKNVSIWNINSFGEFYMQIAEKYKKDYVAGINEIVDARNTFFKDLSNIDYIKPVNSHANYIMCELLNDVKSDELSEYLLGNNIFIKDLTSKIKDGGQWIRLAVRTKEENILLVNYLKDYKTREGK